MSVINSIDEWNVASDAWAGKRSPKLAIVINLDHLRARMAQFVTEVSPDDPTAYTIPFETYLQWEQRQQQEDTNAS